MQFQEETGNLFNLEATPGEGTCYRLAKIDKNLYADIYTSGGDTPYYTNSTLLPVGATEDVVYALEHQNDLQTLYNGGTVFHSFLGEAVPDTTALKNFIIKAMTNTKIPYISVTPTFSVCEDHGYLYGEHFECPECGKDARFTLALSVTTARLTAGTRVNRKNIATELSTATVHALVASLAPVHRLIILSPGK